MHLSLAPSNIERTVGDHKVGYVSLINKNGISVSSGRDVEVELTSSNPEIASVPSTVKISGNSAFAQFEVNTTGQRGQTMITAKLGDVMSSQKLSVGFINENMDPDVALGMAIPTSTMHINSKMPFTVFLKNPDGKFQRATKDIKIDLQYDENIAVPDDKSITIREGQYYAWGTLTSGEVTGNGFLHATQKELDLDSVKNIKVTSTRPTSIMVEVFPKLVNVDAERQIDVFVSLLDSEGNPAVAPNDIDLTLFTNYKGTISDDLDKINLKEKPVIHKGQFGYHLSHKFNLVSVLANFIEIGANAKGFGLDKDTFSTVKATYTPDSERFTKTQPKVTNSVDQTIPKNVGVGYDFEVLLYGPKVVPPGVDSLIGFQTGVIEDDADDPKTVTCTIKVTNSNGTTTESVSTCPNPDFYEVETDKEKCQGEKSNTQIAKGETQTTNTNTQTNDQCNLPIQDVDNLHGGELYPIQNKLSYEKIGGIGDGISITSSNPEVLNVDGAGKLENTQSSGFANLKSGSNSGESVISVAIRGIGSQTYPIKVINSLEQKTTKLFSPFDDTLVVNPDGLMDVFIVPLDSSDRPKKQIEDSSYLITPTNSVLDVKKDQFFSFAQIKSDSSLVGKNSPFVISQVGSRITQFTETKQNFSTNSTALTSILLPNPKMTINQNNNLGVVQLIDSAGNPVLATRDIAVRVDSSDQKVATVSYPAVIPSGKSYGFFGIDTMQVQGKSTLTATAKGIQSSALVINTSPSESSLGISFESLPDSIALNKPEEISFSVFDSNQKSIVGANVEIYSSDDVKIEPKDISTNSNGQGSFKVTQLSGNKLTLSVTASKEGYLDGTKQLVVDVIGKNGKGGISLADFKYAAWMLYVFIAIAAIIGIFIFLFFRKTKEVEDWEEDI